MTHYTTLTKPLWLNIIKEYVDPFDYLHISYTQQSFRNCLMHSQITSYLYHYIEKQLYPYQV